MQVSFLPKNYHQMNHCSPHGVKITWAPLFLEQTKMGTKDNESAPNPVLSSKALTSHLTLEPHQQLLKTQVLRQS